MDVPLITYWIVLTNWKIRENSEFVSLEQMVNSLKSALDLIRSKKVQTITFGLASSERPPRNLIKLPM
jgi:hypothetical protein